MIPTQQKPTGMVKSIPSEQSLRMLLANNMREHVQQLLDIHPELKFKINDKGELEDLITGAALHLKSFITEDEDMLLLKRKALKLANTSDEVLITGETGTGKELIAKSMRGDREGKFVAINCAGLPRELIESELFGHKVGSFTGATSNKDGMLKEAYNGVAFLDEIGELPLQVQGTLLRALQEKEIRPVGANNSIPITCRFVCATHRDLKKMVSQETFRHDLYARISTFELHIKPLKSRKGDIVPILLALGDRLKMLPKAQEFVNKYSEDIMNDKVDLSLNVRSLEQMLKRYNLFGEV